MTDSPTDTPTTHDEAAEVVQNDPALQVATEKTEQPDSLAVDDDPTPSDSE